MTRANTPSMQTEDGWAQLEVRTKRKLGICAGVGSAPEMWASASLSKT